MRPRMLAGLAIVTLSWWGCSSSSEESRRPGEPSARPDFQPDWTRSPYGGRSPDPAPGAVRPDAFQKSVLMEEPKPKAPQGLGDSVDPFQGRLKPSPPETPALEPPNRPRHTKVLVEDELVIVPREGIPPAASGWQEEDLVRGGSLATRVQNRIIPLPLEHTEVKAQLTFTVGSVTVTQQYHNPYSGKIEAVYVFPLPDDAAVRDFILQIGERRIRGIIREREEATQIYLEARRQGHVASLMTQERPNIFTQRVANIEPGRRIDVSITYFHTLQYQDGEFTFVCPMVVGPRYNPPGFPEGIGAVPAGAFGASSQRAEVQYLRPEEIAANDLSLEVAIDAGAEIGAITSPTHAIKSVQTAPGKALVTLSPHDRIPNRDFVLRYRVAGAAIRAGLAVHRDASGGTFALLIHPPDSLKDVPRTAREMIFVIDCSGSMTGRPVEVAKRALVKCLKRLEPDDSFQILRFSDHVTIFERAPILATVDNVKRGIAFTEALEAGGGTEMQEVVRIALDYPVAPGRRRIVSFLTDGFIGNDREVVAFARAHLGGARIFSFGVGSSVNRYLLEALARVGRGVSTFVTLDESTELAAEELYKRIEHPALADLRIDWGGMNVTDVEPSPLPDLYLGRPVMLLGRFRGEAPARVRISGRAGERTFETDIRVDPNEPAARHAALPAVWARTRIAGLQDALIGSGDSREISGEIRTLSLRYGLLSEFTAFLAVDSLSHTAGEFGTTVVQPVPVPGGVQYSTTVERR
jgi:Ca-activated chloride channel family protein